MIYPEVFLNPERFFSRILECFHFQNFVIYKVFAQIYSAKEQQENCFLKEVLKCCLVIVITWKETYCHEDMINSFYHWEELVISYFYSGIQTEEDLNPSYFIHSRNSHGTRYTGRITVVWSVMVLISFSACTLFFEGSAKDHQWTLQWS